MADSDLNQNGNVAVDPAFLGGTEPAQQGINLGNMGDATAAPSQSTFNEAVFSQVNDVAPKKKALDEGENFNSYLRAFFISTILIIIGLVASAAFFSLNLYIKKAQIENPSAKDQEYVNTYKDKFRQVKGWLGKDNRNLYQSPNVDGDADSVKTAFNRIIEANDIDLIDKKELLTSPASNLVTNAQNKVGQIESLKQEIAKQRFLPEELGNLLADEQAMNTIQRSLNALEVIKFSTATKVFSYMNTAKSTISELIRMNGKSAEAVGNLLSEINARGEKDLTSYVYMCYLNPYETSSDCSVIGDFDLYQKHIAKDGFFNDDKLALFKKVMNAIDQLLEKDDTALFAITFNGFNAKDQAITFNIDVYTNQTDELALMKEGKMNPNIFILSSIINLLKQSTFIIGADIDSKAISVEPIDITQGGVVSTVNYSNKQFTVPIQKDTQREIFDYIDLDALMKLLAQNQEDEILEEEDEYLETDTWDDRDDEENNEEVVNEENNEEVVNEENNEEVVDEENNEEVVDEENNEEVVDEENNEEVVDEENNEEVVDEENNEEVVAQEQTNTRESRRSRNANSTSDVN